ncbi:MFS transporter [Paenibacillus thalictri]|uniref:MFS transporter n=1 Tax=Paenibacillus thalictri TaxID=2527873 RepID=A0A4Q9DVL2_9BACL|nr:MFS transporter [Paenibacillus thalictri]TBL81087.1 MFS transporter [Paenibacillus thalictri]
MKKPFVAIFITVLVAIISIATFNPIIGPLARTLGLSAIQSGSMVTITGIFWIIGSFLWGRWAQGRGGRKRILIAALLGYAVTVAMFAYIADNVAVRESAGPSIFWIFIGLRAVAGFFFGAIPAMAQGFLMDWTTAEDRAKGMALYGAASGLGFVIGPAMGAGLAAVGLTAPMYVSAVLLVLVVLLNVFMIKSRKNVTTRQAGRKLSPTDSRIRLYIAVGLAFSTVLILLQVTAGLYMQDRLFASAKEAAMMTGAALSIAGLVVVIAQVWIGRGSKMQPSRLLKIGLCALGLGFACFLVLPSYYMAAFAVIGIGIGFTQPGYTTAASLAVGEEEQTGVASYVSAAQGVGSFVGPLIGTFLYSQHIYLPYLICVAFIGVLYGFVAATAKSAPAFLSSGVDSKK